MGFDLYNKSEFSFTLYSCIPVQAYVYIRPGEGRILS